jgi:hypothetical protein
MMRFEQEKCPRRVESARKRAKVQKNRQPRVYSLRDTTQAEWILPELGIQVSGGFQ